MQNSLFDNIQPNNNVQPTLQQCTVSRRYVLLKNKLGNVFWTMDDGANYEAEGFKVLHRGDDKDEMVYEWQKHYNNRFNGG